VWMVDQRIDHILLGLVVGLAVVLPILKFFSFEFGERLAARPMLSFALLGLVWWSCLQSSAAGFGVLLVALLLWAAQSMIRRAKSRPAARLAVR
jgi:multisubunit Na+/H+ antiporter MnhE subunit